jgi:hypothetical protein
MNQGATELTLILSLAHSHARFLVSWLIAPLEAEYIGYPMLTDVTPQMEDTKTILPAPEAFKSGCASWDRWKADWRFVFIKNEKSSAVYSKVGLYTLVPALLIRMLSFPPNREETSFISFSRSA